MIALTGPVRIYQHQVMAEESQCAQHGSLSSVDTFHGELHLE
jgi:hypothetical protein